MPTHTQVLPYEVYLIATHKNGVPCIEVRRNISDPEIIKTILDAALNNKTIIFKPVFTRPMSALAKLQQLGIIYRDGDKFFFNF